MDDQSAPGLQSGELNRFLYTCPLGLILVDGNGGIRLLNGAAVALLAPYCVHGAMDNFFDFLARWDAEAVVTFRSLVGERRSGTTVVHKLALAPPRGSTVWVEVHARRCADGLSIACRDISDVVAH